MSRFMAPAVAFLLIWFGSGCLPERIDNTAKLEGRPLMELMRQIGQPLEDMTPPKGGEGRVINETQKLWHYMRVSSKTSLVILRSRYSSMFTVKETIVARFENPVFGAININAVDEDIDDDNEIHRGHIKFNASVESPSPGVAKAEIYPFPREYAGEILPPSLQMILPPGFVVPSNSHIDHRKKFMKDTKSMQILQTLVKDIFSVGRREVVLSGTNN